MTGPDLPRTSWTAADLLAAEFAPPRWAVPGLVAEGLTLLVGPPKVGKSWAALGIAVAVAGGGKALGTVKVGEGDVLYLALEDTARRLQSRLHKVLAGAPAPGGLTFATFCEPIPAGGRDRIEGWLQTHPDARLVVVDVFAKVRGAAGRNATAYESDYEAMSALKSIADRHSVSVLVLHHTRKAGADDFLDTVSGTHGLAGAADAVLVLTRSRGQADANLSVSGRDIEEQVYALSFAADRGAWQMLNGPAQDYDLSDTRRAILAHLRDGTAASPKEIAEAIGQDPNTIRQRLWQMAKEGQLANNGGRYLIPVTSITRVTADPPHNPNGYESYEGYEGTGVTDPHNDAQGSDGAPAQRGTGR